MSDNRLHYEDNLKVVHAHMTDASVDLIYPDRQFNSFRHDTVPMQRVKSNTSR